MSDIGLPVSTDQIESLFGIGKRYDTVEIKDANHIFTVHDPGVGVIS